MLFKNLLPRNQVSTQRKFKVLPKGEYKFEVLEISDGQSQSSGNGYLKLKLKIFEPNRFDGVIVWDFLPDIKEMSWKLLGFLKAIDCEALYDKNQVFADQVIGKTGMAFVGVEKDRRNEGEERNKILNYLEPKLAEFDDNLDHLSSPSSDTVKDRPF